MDNILDAPVNSERNFNYAGFWIRVVAYLIDSIILSVANISLGFLFLNNYSMTATNLSFSFISLIVGVLYFSSMESSSRQATLGKMALGIKVGDLGGAQISFFQAFGRYFGRILSGLILGIGFMMAGWDPKKQALHDKLANTYVFFA